MTRRELPLTAPSPTSLKPGPPGVSAPRPLRGRKRNSKRHTTMSQLCHFRTFGVWP
jgi:hypothetical protein